MDQTNQGKEAPESADKSGAVNPDSNSAPSEPKTRVKPQNKYPWLRDIPLITEEAIEKVSRFLDTVVKGREVDLRSPLYDAAPRQEILQKWIKILEPIVVDKPLLAEFERENAKKCSPMSIMAPYAERAEQVKSYFTDPGGDISDDTLALACDAVKEAIGFDRIKRRLRPLSPEAACDRLPTSTSWGLPFSLRGKARRKEKGPVTETADDVSDDSTDFVDNRPLYLRLAYEMMQDFEHPGWKVPCMLYWRGDLGNPEKAKVAEGVKQRVVWGYPHAVSILESMFYPVLTEALKAQPQFAAWVDLPSTERQVFSILEGSTEESQTFGFDASAFDQHLNERLIDAVCNNIIKQAFQEGNEALIGQLSLYSKTCGIVTPEGVMTGRSYNRPSGSGGTNILDCFENLTMFAACMLHRGVEYSVVVQLLILAIIMGDDAVYRLLAIMAGIDEEYSKLFGAKVNVDKETLSVDFTSFCKRLYIRGETQSFASTTRCVLKMVSYERNRPDGWNSYCDSVRWIMQMCPLASHPAFEELIEFAIAGDKYSLGLNVPGGPLQLFRLASSDGSTDLDQILGLEQWANEYTGYSASDPRNLPVMTYLLNKYAGTQKQA